MAASNRRPMPATLFMLVVWATPYVILARVIAVVAEITFTVLAFWARNVLMDAPVDAFNVEE